MRGASRIAHRLRSVALARCAYPLPMRSRAWALQLLGFPALFLAWLYVQQDYLIYHPVRYRRGLPERHAQEGIELRTVRFTTEDGDQNAIFFQPVVGKWTRLYAVFGGNAMVARNWIEVLAESSEPGWADVAFLLLDYPGYGNSSGTPSQVSIRRMGERALHAGARALGIGDRADVSLGMIGHSIGCAAALDLAVATRETRYAFRHIVLSAPFTSLAEEAQAMLPFLRPLPTPLVALLTAKNAWDNKAAVGNLAGQGAPRIDIIHAAEDEIVPHAMGEELFSLLRGSGFAASFKSVPGVGHNDLLSTRTFGKWLRSVMAKP
mmetsp:Transcript_106372/g.297832  ORF Transcript_106372/g.297832 Transcript_106372/m.297832 type:complete len:321 (+) Transcript_106372:37-999(+)